MRVRWERYSGGATQTTPVGKRQPLRRVDGHTGSNAKIRKRFVREPNSGLGWGANPVPHPGPGQCRAVQKGPSCPSLFCPLGRARLEAVSTASSARAEVTPAEPSAPASRATPCRPPRVPASAMYSSIRRTTALGVGNERAVVTRRVSGPMVVPCPGCGRKLGPYSRITTGVPVRCTHCGTTFTVR